MTKETHQFALVHSCPHFGLIPIWSSAALKQLRMDQRRPHFTLAVSYNFFFFFSWKRRFLYQLFFITKFHAIHEVVHTHFGCFFTAPMTVVYGVLAPSSKAFLITMNYAQPHFDWGNPIDLRAVKALPRKSGRRPLVGRRRPRVSILYMVWWH